MFSFLQQLQHLVDITSITGMVVTSHMMNRHLLKIFVKDKKVSVIGFLLLYHVGLSSFFIPHMTVIVISAAIV